LAYYSAAWFPVTTILALTLFSRGEISVGEALFLSAPTGILVALMGLSVWYVCRAQPLRREHLLRAATTHLLAASVFSAVLTATIRSLAGLRPVPEPPALPLMERVSGQLPIFFGLGVMFYLLIAAVYYLIIAVSDSRDAEKHQLKLQEMAGEAELRALKAQINPHFLFNCLNSISSLTTHNPKAAREMCVGLGDFLRRSLGTGEKEAVPLSEELELVTQYLAVEKIRLGDRLQVEQEIDDAARKILLPPLLLQPLVENAVLHGVSTLTEGGTLLIEAKERGTRVRIVIENPYDPEAPRRKGSGLGLNNVKSRVLAHFGKDGRVSVVAEGGRHQVTVSIPWTTPKEGA
ncbi:MAG: histidine kinase, partial [Candidatus Eisenbacteria bacterium]|nr:histidine kinase [Candidatus Eisenbacteria bacterium]